MGVMIRFSAEASEIEHMLRFLSRRMPGGLWMLPLVGADRHDQRFRRTPRPLIERLEEDASPTAWGLRPGAYKDRPIVFKRDSSRRRVVDAEASHLILLQLEEAQGLHGRREGILAVRDWWDSGTSHTELSAQAVLIRNLLERYARRVRRRGHFENGRWYIPF
jgi:hypothetical protein